MSFFIGFPLQEHTRHAGQRYSNLPTDAHYKSSLKKVLGQALHQRRAREATNKSKQTHYSRYTFLSLFGLSTGGL